jgi:CBS domain-containing protein
MHNTSMPLGAVKDAAGDVVGAHMTPAVQSVAVDAPLLAAARIMDAQHVHRLIVLDAKERPIGVVSTMDIVAALLNAIEEMEMHAGDSSKNSGSRGTTHPRG